MSEQAPAQVGANRQTLVASRGQRRGARRGRGMAEALWEPPSQGEPCSGSSQVKELLRPRPGESRRGRERGAAAGWRDYVLRGLVGDVELEPYEPEAGPCGTHVTVTNMRL